MPSTIIYARKSTESEDRQILSIDSQIRELKEFASRRGLRIDRVFTESKSAKSPGRPVFSQVMKQVHKGIIDQVICWKLDRLARNPVDGGALIWAMEEGKLKFIHTPSRSFENTGDNKFWMQLEFGMAKKYVDDLSDNVKRGMRAKIEMGWLPNRAPLGYLNDRNTATIIPDPERFRLVQKMWELMLSGNYTPKRILEIAGDEWGLRTRPSKWRGGGPLTRSAIYTLFRHPFYYGAIVVRGVLYPGIHEPMISKSDFDKVQEMLGRRQGPRPHEHKFAFTGLIKCGECGASVTAEHKVQRHGYRYVYYHCTKRKVNRDCSQRVIEVRELERQIAAFLDSITISPGIVEWASWVLRDMYGDETTQEQTEQESLRRRLDRCTGELRELVNVKLRGLLSDEEFSEKKNELESERFRIRELLNDNHGRVSRVNDEVVEAFRFAETARKRFERGSLEDKRAVLQYTGSNLTLVNGILRIEPQKPLFFIQKALEQPKVKSLVFEPPKLRELQRQTADAKGPMRVLWGVVDEIRTYVRSQNELHLAVE